KSEWPELVGTCGEVAAKTIEKENSLVSALIVRPFEPVALIFSCARVVVAVDEKGIVIRVPTIG
ncbi:UNVERIFIED_CONTAM: hypothetical protein Sindi_0991800, partial [Sesamum indicum]